MGIWDKIQEINGCTIRATVNEASDDALQRAQKALTAMGYQLEEQTDHSLALSMKGSIITANPDKMRHTLSLKVDGETWTFLFSTGLVASYWTETDLQWANQRVEAVVNAL